MNHEKINNKTTVGASVPKNQPLKSFRAGPVKATVWENVAMNAATSEGGHYKTISIERVYKDKEGEWQKTNSMRVNDLPKATVVLNKAYEFLTLSESKQSSES